VVHLEDAKLRIRVAVSEGIKACTEKNILRNTLGNGAGKRVFSVATACDDEGAKGDGERTVRTRGSATKFFSVGVAEERDGYGIIQDKRLGVVELVRSTTESHAKCSSRWAGILHDERR
jgi:hypothetical protein